MEKKKYVVRFTFTTQIESEDDSHALEEAAMQLRYGFSATRSTEIKVVAALPIAETPAPKEVERAPEVVISPATPSDDIPF